MAISRDTLASWKLAQVYNGSFDGRVVIDIALRGALDSKLAEIKERYAGLMTQKFPVNEQTLAVRNINVSEGGENITMTAEPISYHEKVMFSQNLTKRKDLSDEDRALLQSLFEAAKNPLKSSTVLPRPLYGALLLKCGDGASLVLQVRSEKSAINVGRHTASVTEGFVPEDATEGRLDVTKAFRRGLEEELGLAEREVREVRPLGIVYSFENNEYGIIADATTPLSKDGITRAHSKARDAWEAQRLSLLPYPPSPEQLGKATPSALVSIAWAMERDGLDPAPLLRVS